MTIEPLGDATAGAGFSPCHRYRYRLWRRWGAGESVLWIMLNPSTADHERLDPTITRCRDYSRRWGFDAMEVCNLFALRATDPRALMVDRKPVGPDNDRVLIETAHTTGLIVLAWGNHGRHRGRADEVIELLRGLGRPLHCLRINRASGTPAHPLYQRAELKPQPFRAGEPGGAL
jgi:hypothetical protein